MTSKEMHYDFESKFNRVNSTVNRSFHSSEIDWALNEAQEVFVKLNVKGSLGAETEQTTMDRIRPIVVEAREIAVSPLRGGVAPLPLDYNRFLRARGNMSKGSCLNVRGIVYIRQKDDMFEENSFSYSSFEWRCINASFNEEGLKLYNEDFDVDKIFLSYIRTPRKIETSGYTFPDGRASIDSDCELPEDTHREIVDIATAIKTGDIQPSNYNIKMNKLNFLNIKPN